jgi:hypothetical protein
MKLKNTIVLMAAFVLLADVACIAQSLQRQSIGASGSVTTGTNGSLSASLGQSAQEYITTGSARLTQGFQQPEFDLSLLPVFGPFCNGDTIDIPYALLGLFGSGSVVSAELSDPLGSFASSSLIGSYSAAASGSIVAVVPFDAPPGAAYRVRLQLASPSRTSNVSNAQVVNVCSVKLNLLALIEGLYSGSGTMSSALANSGVSTDFTIADSIAVELHSAISPFETLHSLATVLHIDGSATCVFPSVVYGGSYYVVLRHRSSVETWSKSPVLFSEAVKSYDFIH